LGFAHIGALQALGEHGVFPYRVSGASIGALIGVMYAAGYTPTQITEIVKEHKLYNITKIISPMEFGLKAGFSGHKSIEKLLREYLPHNRFEALQRPFAVSVADLRAGEWKIVSSGGHLVEYVLASMSIPLAFEPVNIGNGVYVDGGMMNNLPVEPLIGHCRRIIGVDVQTAHPFAGKVTRGNILQITYRLFQKQMNRDRVAKCHSYLTFPELDEYGVSDFSKYEEITAIGYKRTKAYIAANPDVLTQRGRLWKL
jgi:NTE family protein